MLDAVEAKNVPVVVALPFMVEDALEINPLLNVCKLLHVFAVVVPNARLNTPVAELYWIGYVAEIEEEARRPRVLVAIVPTTPLVALRRPVSVPMPKLVVVALVVEAFVANKDEKILCALHVFAVVVPNARLNNPVEELYWIGYVPESEVDEILLLNVLKSVEERYPFDPVPDCEIEKTPVPWL